MIRIFIPGLNPGLPFLVCKKYTIFFLLYLSLTLLLLNTTCHVLVNSVDQISWLLKKATDMDLLFVMSLNM